MPQYRRTLFIAVGESDLGNDGTFTVVQPFTLGNLELRSPLHENVVPTYAVTRLTRGLVPEAPDAAFTYFDWSLRRLPGNALVQEVPPPGIVLGVVHPRHVAAEGTPIAMVAFGTKKLVADSPNLIRFLDSTDATFAPAPIMSPLWSAPQPTRITIPGSPDQLKVFLCHASDDKVAVRELYHRLCAANVNAWLDTERVVGGRRWKGVIKDAIRQSHVILVCISHHSTTKEGYVQREIRQALQVAQEKPEGAIYIVPLRLEDAAVPHQMEHWQWIDLFRDDGFAKLLVTLQSRASELSEHS
jgi:hypothetical protein